MELSFSKYHGLGNDYLNYDPQKNACALTDADVRKICHRNYGLGSDGILGGPVWKGNEISVRILNPDGGEAEKSGNGVRIFSRYLKDAGYVKTEEFDLLTLGGRGHVTELLRKGRCSIGICAHFLLERRGGRYGAGTGGSRETMSFGTKEYECTCESIGTRTA